MTDWRDDPRVSQMVLGQVISQLRRRMKMSQTEFAAAIGVTQSTLSRIELGESIPDALVLRRIAAVTGSGADHIFRLVDRSIDHAKSLAVAANKKLGRAEDDWWGRALLVLGAVGLAGLIALAVAAILESQD